MLVDIYLVGSSCIIHVRDGLCPPPPPPPCPPYSTFLSSQHREQISKPADNTCRDKKTLVSLKNEITDNLTEKEHSQPLKAQGLSWSQRYGGGRGMGQNPPTPALVAGGARAIQLHMLMLHYCKNLFNTSS